MMRRVPGPFHDVLQVDCALRCPCRLAGPLGSRGSPCTTSLPRTCLGQGRQTEGVAHAGIDFEIPHGECERRPGPS
jgi:hypothetical protein